MVTIERNEIILERDVVLDEENINLISDIDADTIILQKEDLDVDYSIIYNTLQKTLQALKLKRLPRSIAS